jgi:hypothetical protein
VSAICSAPQYDNADIYTAQTGGTNCEGDITWYLNSYYDRVAFNYYINNGLYIQATNASTSLKDIEVSLIYYDNYYCTEIDSDTVNFTAYKVADVQWATFDAFDGNIEIDTCPAPNGGKRIFPDKKTYADDELQAARRKKVYVEATITPVISGQKVYFSAWDVDDPSSSDKDGSANTSGPDNYGTGYGGLLTTFGMTDSYGKAQNILIVSMNPGDNFKVAAAGDENQVKKSTEGGQMTQAMADGTATLPSGAMLSPMLTVWRKLHLELDSMASGQDHPVTNRNLDETYANTPHTGESGAEVHGWDPDLDEGQYEGGSLTVDGATFEIIDNIDDFGDDTVYVNGNICPKEDKSASFTDDDVCPLPRKADWSIMNTKFAPAYIVVVEESGVSNLDATFQANLGSSDAAQEGACSAVRQLVTSPNYWMLQVLSCHQGQRSEDGDPDLVYHYHSNSDYKNGDNFRLGQCHTSSNAVAIFLETCRDAGDQFAFLVSVGLYGTAYTASQMEQKTICHEAGHAFGCGEMEGGIMTNTPDPSLNFVNNSIVKIRSYPNIGE